MQELCGEGTERRGIAVNNDECRGYARVGDSNNVVLLDPDEDRRRLACCTQLLRLLPGGSAVDARHVEVPVGSSPSLERSDLRCSPASTRTPAMRRTADSDCRPRMTQGQVQNHRALKRFGCRQFSVVRRSAQRAGSPITCKRELARQAGIPAVARRAAERFLLPTAPTIPLRFPSFRYLTGRRGCSSPPGSRSRYSRS